MSKDYITFDLAELEEQASVVAAFGVNQKLKEDSFAIMNSTILLTKEYLKAAPQTASDQIEESKTIAQNSALEMDDINGHNNLSVHARKLEEEEMKLQQSIVFSTTVKMSHAALMDYAAQFAPPDLLAKTMEQMAIVNARRGIQNR